MACFWQLRAVQGAWGMRQKVRLDQSLVKLMVFYPIGNVDPLKSFKLRILSDLFYYYVICDLRRTTVS